MWLAFAWCSTAVAEVPPRDPAAQTASSAFHDQLALAKQHLQRGDPDAAHRLLLALRDRLDEGEQPPRTLANEALVYLGDAQYVRGEKQAARESFRRVLLDDSSYAISPYHHTEEVRAYFALVRDAVETERASLPPPMLPPPAREPPLPWWGFAPLGLPQAGLRKPGRAALYGGLQAAFAAGSIAAGLQLKKINRDSLDHPYGWTSAQVRTRATRLKYGVQWPLTAAFYTTWAVSVIDAGRTWKRMDHGPAEISLRVGPSGVAVHGRF